MTKAASNTQERVLLALSGGVDSAVAAHLLMCAGHPVEGLVIRFSPQHKAAVAAAETAANELGIRLHVADCEEAFDRLVVRPFCKAYANGRTPNPCVLCNPAVKFQTLAKKADELGIPAIATGHYARVVRCTGGWRVGVAASLKRDQSYMLYRLPQSILCRLLLPAGELEKDAIRTLAHNARLSSADAPDSQDICFVPGGDYAAYIEARGYYAKPGRFIAPDGRDLGPHSGVAHYTVGQRKGLGVALGAPVYIRRITPAGDILLGWAAQGNVAAIRLSQVICAEDALYDEGSELLVKIRSMAQAVPCTVQITPAGPRVVFKTPQRAPAPGQHAVLYRQGLVVGGGVIENDEPFFESNADGRNYSEMHPADSV